MSAYVPNLTHPTQAQTDKPLVLQISPPDTTPLVLGTANLRMKGMQLRAEKAALTANAGNVTIQVKNAAGTFEDLYVMAPGDIFNWPSSESEAVSAANLKVTIVSAGDGLRIVYYPEY